MVQINSIHYGIKMSLNVFKYHIVYSNILLMLKESGLQFVSVTFSFINNKLFHNIYNNVYLYNCGTNLPVYEHTYVCTLPRVSDSGKFNVENLYEKFWNLILDHEAD